MNLVRSVVFVIEPDRNLADALHDMLTSWGFQVATFATHRGAATSAVSVDQIDLLVACVPTSDGDRDGAYLEAAAARQGGQLPIILMLGDPSHPTPAEPPGAIRLVKPFTPRELWAAVEAAGGAVTQVERPG